MRGKRGGISFTTSAISTSGGRVKFISKIDVFMGFSYKQPSIGAGWALVPIGISFVTSCISISGGRVKVILNMDVFMGFS